MADDFGLGSDPGGGGSLYNQDYSSGGGNGNSSGGGGGSGMGGLLPAGLQAGFGVYQLIKGRKLAKNNIRPEYQVPSEIMANLSQAQRMALEGLPASVKEEYIKNLQRQQSFSLDQMSSRKAGLTGLSAIMQQGTDAYGNLMSQDAMAKQQNLQNLMNVRSQVAGYKDKQFELNKLNPYYEKAQAAAAMKGAGLQNLMGGIQGATKTLDMSKALGGGGGSGGGDAAGIGQLLMMMG